MSVDPTFLETLWFVLICVLWIGYFVLEGFDFGVGMLLRRVGRTRGERRMVIHTIGPVWDGNEVWLLVAGGATFAAFPGWYASLFSGFYLALFLILVGIIVRNVAFEFWGKSESESWRNRWEWALVVGSAIPALLWGVGWANIVDGVPLNAAHDFTGTLFTLLTPYALLGGVTTLLLFLAHGAVFLTLRTQGDVAERSRAAARAAVPGAALAALAFLGWTVARQSDRGGVQAASLVVAIVAVGALAVAAAVAARRPSWGFAASAAGIALVFAALFVDLYPNALVSTGPEATTLTLAAAASTKYTLTVMTVVAALLVPVVLLYQGWTYWVFRHRLDPRDYDVRSPLDLLDRSAARRPGGPGSSAGADPTAGAPPPGG